jgi:hypothetical protein
VAESKGFYYVLDVADGAVTGVYKPQRERGHFDDGSVDRFEVHPFGGADEVGFSVEMDTTGTVEVRGGSGGAQKVLRTITDADETNFIVGPIPVLDFNVTANATGIRIRAWGQ